MNIQQFIDRKRIRHALLRAVFPLARIEEYQDAGACAVRKDICLCMTINMSWIFFVLFA
ncbi:MAG: hypothetical protein J6O61_01830 [Butyrivibrio sp.]|uniref:hypothetical protein n=1 Tax=Butyrivibrio sp. TaxID=28121 RepID=UPI001B1B16DE|nr:hypothetical protein [Butyrivibrio sp.]MBO6239574.1 hypothetical protein [Butyrivibrio sp.]